jgi:hypothetical protein
VRAAGLPSTGPQSTRGCSRVSPGCEHCYAERMAHRFSGEGQPYEGLTRSSRTGPKWTGAVQTIDELLSEPLRWREPRLVFVSSMSDLFHERVPDELIERVFYVMTQASGHTAGGHPRFAASPRHRARFCRPQPLLRHRTYVFCELLTCYLQPARVWNDGPACRTPRERAAFELLNQLFAPRADVPWAKGTPLKLAHRRCLEARIRGPERAARQRRACLRRVARRELRRHALAPDLT